MAFIIILLLLLLLLRLLLLYHIPQRDEDRKHGDPASEGHRSGRVGGCPEGLKVRWAETLHKH